MHSHHAQHLKDKHKQTQTGRNWLDAISDNLYPPPMMLSGIIPLFKLNDLPHCSIIWQYTSTSFQVRCSSRLTPTKILCYSAVCTESVVLYPNSLSNMLLHA